MPTSASDAAEPSAHRAKQSTKAAYNAQTWYIEQPRTMVLDEILARVYVIPCQLVHGAATYVLYARYKHRRPGHLFQGRFKAKLVEEVWLGP